MQIEKERKEKKNVFFGGGISPPFCQAYANDTIEIGMSFVCAVNSPMFRLVSRFPLRFDAVNQVPAVHVVMPQLDHEDGGNPLIFGGRPIFRWASKPEF